jgi:hypothetical protein
MNKISGKKELINLQSNDSHHTFVKLWLRGFKHASKIQASAMNFLEALKEVPHYIELK